MGIAMFTVSNLFAPLQGVLNWFMPATPQQTARTAAQCARQTLRPALVSTGKAVPVRLTAKTCAPKPLRVLRVIEANAPASAGRMVISGRMADVCAELDRLAALEATWH